MASNVNRAVISGRLTRDPELRSLPSGMSVCSLRLAFNTSQKDPDSGEWGEKSNYIDVTVWGKRGETVAQYMAKGRALVVDGRLEWREWTDKEGNSRQSIEVVADNVEFVGGMADEQRDHEDSGTDAPDQGQAF